MRNLIAIFILSGLGVSCFGQVEFVGIMESGDGRRFCLRDTKHQKTSDWLRLDQTFGDARLLAFDAQRGILTVEQAGARLELPLREPQVHNAKDSDPLPVSPTRYKVGSVVVKGPLEDSILASVVRDAMQIRPGGSFNEASIDHDIRSIYRTGRFKSVEITFEKRSDDTYDLVVAVTKKTP